MNFYFSLFILLIGLNSGLLAQNPPVWNGDETQNIQDFNEKVETFLSKNKVGCLEISESPLTFESRFFREVDEWAKPVFIGQESQILSFKPSKKRGYYYYMGDSLYHVRDYEGARNAYRKAINDQWRNWFSYLYIGDTFFIFDQLDTAKYWFEASVQTNPKSWKAWKYLGDLYFEMGDSSAAVDAAVRSILLNPYGFEGWGLLGIIGQKYGFSIWNPADSTPVIQDLNGNCLLLSKKHENSEDYRALANYLLMTPDSLQNRKKWEQAYSVFSATWESYRPDTLTDIYLKEPYREYIAALVRTGEIKQHVTWAHVLSQNPEAGMVLPDEDFEVMVEFFKDHFLISNSED